MSYLLDTNVISETSRGERCHPHVLRWYHSIAASDLFLSVLVLGELRKGVELARRRDRGRGVGLDQWLTDILTAFDGRVIGLDIETAQEWGRLNAIRTLPAVDGLLAATAIVKGMTLVTRNTSDVADLGVAVFNPFLPA